MERTKKPVNVWGIAGIILSLCTLFAVIFGLNSTPAVLVSSAAVVEAAEQTLECVCSGDYQALGQMLYGAPDLGTSPEKNQEAQSLIWYAYLDSIEYQLEEDCTATESGMAVKANIHCLDIAAAAQALQAVVPTLMTQSQAANASEAEIAQVLSTATAQVLAQQHPMMERELTLNLVRSGGSWQVVPTEELQNFLSGYVSE